MAPHSSTLAWKIPRMEEPGRLQSMGLLRVGHDWVTSLSLFTFMHWRRKWQPTPVFLPGESQGWRSLMGCRHGFAQRWTRLKQLSSSSSILSLFWILFQIDSLFPLFCLVWWAFTCSFTCWIFLCLFILFRLLCLGCPFCRLEVRKLEVPLYCGACSMWVGLDKWLVKVSCLRELASMFWWVELELSSEVQWTVQ